MSAVLGVIAAHLQRAIVDPAVLHDPMRMFNRQYAVSYSAYVLLSALALLIGSRYQQTLSQLATTRREQVDRDRDHLIALQAALEREQSARREAEDANQQRELLLARLSRELDRVQQLAAIVESSDDMIVGTDVAGTIQSWNRAAEQTFGIAAADAVGQSIDIIVPPDRRESELALRTTIERGESVVHFSTERRRQDGTVFPVSLTMSPIHDGAGALVGISRTARDTSMQVQAERDVAELQARLLALLSAAQSVLRSPTLEDVGPAVLQTAHDLIAANACALWRVNGQTGTWHIQTSRGVSARFIQQTVPAAAAGRLDDLVAVPDVTTAPFLGVRQAAYAAEGVKAMLSVPLTRGG